MISVDISKENTLEDGLSKLREQVRSLDKANIGFNKPKEEVQLTMNELQWREFTTWLTGSSSISFGYKQKKIKDTDIDVVRLYGRTMFIKKVPIL